MAPSDRRSIVYYQFFFLGVSSLLPWNFFITADSFWSEKFDQIEAENATTNSSNITSTDSSSGDLLVFYRSFNAIFSMLPQVMFTFYSTLPQHKVNERRRVYTNLIIMSLVFVVISCFVKVDTDSFQTAFFVFIMITVFIVNAASAFVTASIFGSAARFPQRYPQSVMAGQGMSGLFSAIAFIIAITVTNDATEYALIFFILAVIFLLSSTVCYYFMENNEFFIHYNTKRSSSGEDAKDCEPLKVNSNGNDESMLENGDNVGYVEPAQASYFRTFKKIFLQWFSCFFGFFVTLANFPAVAASVKSSHPGTLWGDKYFLPVSCFFLYSLTDFLGRALTSKISIPSQNNRLGLVIFSLSRCVFFFCFAFCNSFPTRRHTAPLFADDAYYVIFMFLFGLTNGYVTTLAMKYSPQMVQTQEERQLVGKLMSFSISCGLACGAAFSFVAVSFI